MQNKVSYNINGHRCCCYRRRRRHRRHRRRSSLFTSSAWEICTPSYARLASICSYSIHGSPLLYCSGCATFSNMKPKSTVSTHLPLSIFLPIVSLSTHFDVCVCIWVFVCAYVTMPVRVVFHIVHFSGEHHGYDVCTRTRRATEPQCIPVELPLHVCDI